MALWLAVVFGLGWLLNPSMVYPVRVLYTIDGDTFRAESGGTEMRVRLRDIDAPELHARCHGEYVGAVRARLGLQRLLAAGAVTITDVGVDKYLGRVDATVATRGTPDVSAAMLRAGLARPYNGGHRGSWC
jgi:endonuclease YncB( thermonuclease family)